ncbi:DMT family transporter [Thalassococcus sp. BH17M4-6]|uniref:DMT family transporter n=1 Tax=Thalassococcus sp. BH17M4-6 TaxID=3413148 RepID=UPI003BDA21F9
MTDNLRGSAFMVLAMLGFALEDAFFKSATGLGSVSPGVGTVMFGLLAFTIFAGIARAKQIPLWHPAYLQRGLLIRTGFEICGRLFFALALAYTPLSTTSAILQAAPLVVTLGAVLVLGETVGPRRWAAMAVGFAGVLMILRPTPSGFEASAIFAVLGMIGFAGRDLATRTSPAQVHSAQLGLLGFAVVTLAGAIIILFEAGPPALPGADAALRICGTAFCGVLGYSALTRAMRTGEVSVVAPFRYSRLIFALIIAVAIFGERPDAMTLAGAALIVVSGGYTLLRSRPERRLP